MYIPQQSSIFPSVILFLLKPTMKTLSLALTLILFCLNISPLNSQLTTNFTTDYGRVIISDQPIQILTPANQEQLSSLLQSIFNSPNPRQLKVAARGAGHSTYGQAQAPDGVVIDMKSLPGTVTISRSNGMTYADVSGGVLWIDLLNETLKQGVAPRSWTDYLYLTVGGTLSNAGISGQAFEVGPQISNVLELDVVTGKGDIFTCSKESNSELFYAVLGGLGQFGIITRARIILNVAPKMVRRVSRQYDDFDSFTRDQERIISMPQVNYLEGSMSLAPANSSGDDGLVYKLEFATYYDDPDDAQKTLDLVTSRLNWRSEASFNVVDVAYFDFLNRVRAEEMELRRQGLWEVAHPWVNLFVPRDQVKMVKNIILDNIPRDAFGGVFLIYPTFKNKWDPRTSAVLPQDKTTDRNIMYVVSVLRTAPPSCTEGTRCLTAYLVQNRRIVTSATALGAKQYLPYWQNQIDWALHFGDEKWGRMVELKSKFDPLHTLAPGQRMFL